MNAFLTALFTALFEGMAKFLARSRVALDSDQRPDLLRRAGSRISSWMQQSRAHSRVKPDQDRPKHEV